MDQERPPRDELDVAFLSTYPWMRRLERKRRLGRAQRLDYESTLYLWFRRFARRPGCVGRPVKSIRWSLIRVAYRAARALDHAKEIQGDA